MASYIVLIQIIYIYSFFQICTLFHYNRDLHQAFLELADRSSKNYLQGDSFGTFWGQRYITMFPDDFDAVVMESFAVPGFDSSFFEIKQTTELEHVFIFI